MLLDRISFKLAKNLVFLRAKTPTTLNQKTLQEVHGVLLDLGVILAEINSKGPLAAYLQAGAWRRTGRARAREEAAKAAQQKNIILYYIIDIRRPRT